MRAFCRVLRGACGSSAQTELLEQCESLLDAAAQDLPNIEVQCQTFPAGDGRRRFGGFQVLGHRNWEPWSALLCSVIALNIDHPRLQERFLELLDVTEWSLRAAVHKAAETAGLKPGPIWSEAVRLYGGVLQHATVDIPCCSILSTLRKIQMYPREYKQGLPIRGPLMERAVKTPSSHFSILALLEDLLHDHTIADVRATISLVKQAWESEVYILRISALDLLRRMSREVHENAPQELPGIRAMLESFHTNDIFVSTSVLEALLAYDGLEPPISADATLSEMRAVIDPDAASDPPIIESASVTGVSVQRFLSDQAYSLLGRIFEDVFQGAYYEAYSELSDEEKGTILNVAANCSTPGFHTGWVLRELLRYGGERAVAVYERFAAGPDRDSFSPQEAAEAFALGVEGCARWGSARPM
jgi:hypothetical protein